MADVQTIVHAMLTRSRKKLMLASALSNAVYAYLFAQKRVIMEDGGPSITNPLIVGRNPNITSMSYYDTVPVAQTDEFTTVSYNMSRVVGSLIISEQEQDENKGSSVIFKILEGKITALDESIKEKFSDYLVSAGAGTDPNGLPNLIPDDPTTGSIGGINLATESQFRPSVYDFNAGLDANNIEEAFDDVMLDLTRGSEKPDVIFVGRDIFRLHRTAARDKMQISLGATGVGKALVNLGVVGTTHQGTPMIFDEKLDPNTAYFINTKYLTLHILTGVNMKVKQLTAPWNVDAIGRRVCWEGQLCVWRQHRTNGKVLNS
ncbi:MAG: phage major capsid protein [Nitrososphaera sp.]|nr:phage major capsid protein [Nitrososphaera sp.]